MEYELMDNYMVHSAKPSGKRLLRRRALRDFKMAAILTDSRHYYND